MRQPIINTHSRIEQALQRVYRAVKADYLYVAAVDEALNEASTLCVVKDGARHENFSYALSDTPCKEVFRSSSVLIRANVQETYPADTDLRNMKIEGYIGEALRDDDDNLLGVFVGLFKKPIDQPDLVDALFGAVSGYVATELTRVNDLTQLAAANEEVDNTNALIREIELISLTGGWQVDLRTNQLTWTPGSYAIHGMTEQEELDPQTAIMFYEASDQDIISNAFKQLCDYGKPYSHELRITDAKGRKKWVKTTGNAKRNELGEVTLVYGAIEDISTEKQMLQREKDRSKAFAATLNALHDSVITINASGTIIDCNRTTLALLGYTYDELIGNNVSMIMPEEDASRHDEYISKHVKTNVRRVIGINRELFAKHKSGNEIPIELSLSTVQEDNELHFVGIIRDISERKESETKLKYLALTDKVTKLPNINSFEMALSMLLKGVAVQDDIYVAILDVSRFSEINHAYGADVGNLVLKAVAERIREKLDNHSYIYRYLSDTFVILHRRPVAKQDEVLKRRLMKQEEDIIESVRQDLDVNGNKHNIALSVASGMFDGSRISLEGIEPLLNFIRNEAKGLAEGGVFRMSSSKLALFELQRNIQRSMLDSLRKNEFYLVLQPKYDVKGDVHSSEALLRWNHAEYGLISPAKFIPIAEQNGDIIQLFRWVLNEVCSLIKALQTKGIKTKVSINVSGRDIMQHNFVDIVHQTLTNYVVSPSSIVFEITETTLIKDMEAVKKRMDELAVLGHQFSIDDFGTGYSSFKYLDSLPIQELKIDQYFVSKIGEKEKINIIDSIVGMAKMLKLMTVAEGVETEAQANYLKQIGCDLLQGYYLSKPLEKAQWLELIEAKNHNKRVG